MKSKILKFIFVLSFIPYIYIMLDIIFSGYVFNGVELQGIERLLENIKSDFQM